MRNHRELNPLCNAIAFRQLIVTRYSIMHVQQLITMDRFI